MILNLWYENNDLTNFYCRRLNCERPKYVEGSSV